MRPLTYWSLDMHKLLPLPNPAYGWVEGDSPITSQLPNPAALGSHRPGCAANCLVVTTFTGATKYGERSNVRPRIV